MPVRLATDAMATRFELVLDGAPEATLRAAGEAALARVREEERRWSRFRAGSIPARVRALRAGAAMALDPDAWALLSLCREVHRDSGGAFDPAVGALMDAAGLHEGAAGAAAAGGPVGFARLTLDDEHRALRAEADGVALDFGAVAKGFALDLAVETLRDAGVPRALLHGGTSSVATIGAPPDGDGWRVSLGDAGARTTAVLCDTALGVSAPHGRAVEAPGGGAAARVTHVLDPRTRRSAARAILAAVVARSAAVADAWSTALLVDPDLVPPPASGVLDHAAWCADGTLRRGRERWLRGP